MSALGIGVRVYVGWTAKTNRPDLCCRTGTLTDGPLPAGTCTGMRHTRHTSWWVQVDGGPPVVAAEYLLTPIDPNAEPIQTEQREGEIA